MKIHSDFADFIEELDRHSVQFVVVGAYALASLGAPRFTGDIDIWVRPSAANAKRLLRAVDGFGFTSLALTGKDILSGKVIQIGHPPVRIDLLTRLDGVTAKEIWAGRRQGELGGRPVFLMGRAALVKNKRAAGRPKDLADLAALGEPPRKAAD